MLCRYNDWEVMSLFIGEIIYDYWKSHKNICPILKTYEQKNMNAS